MMREEGRSEWGEAGIGHGRWGLAADADAADEERGKGRAEGRRGRSYFDAGRATAPERKGS
jgi:hypothetical protein